MSDVNEIQGGIDDEIDTALTSILTIIAAITTAGIGLIVGAFVGFYGLIYFCHFLGGGLGQADWVLIIFTVPAGMLGGAILGGSLPFLFLMEWK